MNKTALFLTAAMAAQTPACLISLQKQSGEDGNTYLVPPSMEFDGYCSRERSGTKWVEVKDLRLASRIAVLKTIVKIQLPQLDSEKMVQEILENCIYRPASLGFQGVGSCEASCIDSSLRNSGTISYQVPNSSPEIAKQCMDNVVECTDIRHWRHMNESHTVNASCNYIDDNRMTDIVTTVWMPLVIHNIELSGIKPEDLRQAVYSDASVALFQTTLSFAICPSKIDPNIDPLKVETALRNTLEFMYVAKYPPQEFGNFWQQTRDSNPSTYGIAAYAARFQQVYYGRLIENKTFTTK